MSAQWIGSTYRRVGVLGAVVGTAVGTTAAGMAGPLVIGAIGFGAGSMAASMIFAKGSPITAKSLVSIIRTIGAVGFGVAGLTRARPAEAEVGAAGGGGVGVEADLVAGSDSAATPPDGAEGGAENSGDVAEAMENLTLDESELQPTEELLSIIVSELDGNVRRFTVKSLEPFQGMFDQYYVETGLSPESVFFEFNGLRLEGSESPAQFEIEDCNIVKALRI